jgi:enamine deaminase RidA (YjgF/YER057c/UK114 family)
MLLDQNDIQIRTLTRAGCTEIFASAVAPSGESAAPVLDPLAQLVARGSARMAALDVYGPPDLWHRPPACVRWDGAFVCDLWDRFSTCLLTGETPVPQQEGSRHPTAAQLWAIGGTEVQPVVLEGRAVGVSFADGQARYVRLGGILPANGEAPRAEQARQVFEAMDAALRRCDMSFRNVVRTWFYNRDILAWYDEFNAVRNAFFTERGIERDRLPASTGIGARPVSDAALVGGLLALKPLRTDADVRVAVVRSPRQGPAPEYGSAFSRAVEIVAPDHRRLLISGTASIDEHGRTLHPGDVRGQMAETFDIVQRLLESRAMSWTDVMRGVAYFRRAADIPLLREYMRRQNLPALHVLPVVATICREELLFELEVDAAVVVQGA